MIQTPFTKPDRYICCPACGKCAHTVSHLPPGTHTAWYCDDCGVRFSLHVISADAVDCAAMPEWKEKRLVTLRSTGRVTLLVEGMVYLPNDQTDRECLEYYYNEHTCPINYMRDVVEVIDADGDVDPHGVFEFVSSEPWVDQVEGG